MNKKTYTHLSYEERQQIRYHLDSGYSLRAIASMLGRSHTSLSRELRRNSCSKRSWKGYNPPSAKQKAYVRRKNSKYQGMKMEKDRELRAYVIEKLREQWTPEMISGRLKYCCTSNFNETSMDYVSPQWIYDWLYSWWWQRYCKYLPSQQTRVRKRRKKKTKREMIPSRLWIELRESEANDRRGVGHWEVDTMISGKKTGSKVALWVVVDRKSRYTCLYKMKNLQPRMMNAFLEKRLVSLPRTTLTYDNGIENKWHMRLHHILNVLTFFCDPYSSWQKGTVENTIWRIRRYIPKWSDVWRWSTKQIQEIEDWLNHTPRKCLNYKTPYEVMQEGIQWEKVNKEHIQKNPHLLPPNYSTWVC
jgi:transposase, IS30 family